MENIKFKDGLLILMLSIIIVINSLDFMKDISQGDEWLHIVLEIMTVILAFWGIIMLVKLINNRTKEISSLHQQVSKSESDLVLSKNKLKAIGHEYSKYIHEQFESWGLTPSEKDVALILLKGLSFKEMAEVRETKEKTIRQQASTIYKKSNVSGRHEFSAWFFEDMLISPSEE